MKKGKIRDELMKIYEETRSIEGIRRQCSEQKSNGTCITSETSGNLFHAPVSELNVSSICWKRVPRPGKLAKKWSDFSARSLPDLSGRKVRFSEPEIETLPPPPPDPVVPQRKETPPPKKEPEKPVVTTLSQTQQILEKMSKTVTPVENQKKETVRPKVPDIAQEPPKPLKVIRRRREEAPKVFETPPRTVPIAMLEGISLESDEDGST